MNEPIFLSVDEVLQIHAFQVEQHGGSTALLSMERLESALAQPCQSFGGSDLHSDLEAMAAAYLYHIVQNHPFEDGNKRTGTHAAIIFLELNGCDLGELPEDAEHLVMSVARGEATKARVADYFRKLIGK